MKKFLLHTVYFLLPVIALGVLLEASIRVLPNDYTYKKEYLDKSAGKIEILILGSSHSFYDLNPDFLPANTFNAAHISQTLDLDLELLQKYGNDLVNVKTIIVPVSYFSFFETLESSQESWRVKNYVMYYGLDSGSLIHHSEVLSNKFPVNIKVLFNAYLKGESLVACSPLGWGNKFEGTKPLDYLETTGPRTAERHTIKDKGLLEDNRKTLHAIADICKQKNINLVLYTPPGYKSYTANLNKQQWNLTLKTIEALKSSYDKCHYVNFLENPALTAEDYFDPDHLNAAGAKKFSMLFSRYIEEEL